MKWGGAIHWSLVAAILAAACGGQTDQLGSPGAGGFATGGAGNSIGGSSGGAAGGTSGELAAFCRQLLLDYGLAAAQANVCDPLVSSMQCQATRAVGLVCACERVVNAGQPSALRQLDVLEAAWLEVGCSVEFPAPCPICQQIAPTGEGGGCSPDGVCRFRTIQ